MTMTLTADDKFAIQHLASGLYFALDAKDPARYVEGFAADATLSHPFGQTVGREDIRRWVEGYIAQGYEDGSRHCIMNPVVEPHAEGALFRSYVMKLTISVTPPVIATGSLELVLARAGTQWQVRRKAITVDGMPAQP